MFQKKILLAVTDQNEGNIFVNVNETMTITDYISQLFPDMTYSEVEGAAAIYQDYGTAVEQAIMVMGDCESFTVPFGRHERNCNSVTLS